MAQAKTDGKLLEAPPSIDVEGLVKRLRQQAEEKSTKSPQGHGLLGPDPVAGTLAKQAEFNHGLVTAMGAMLEHLQRLEERCINLEGKLTRQSQQEQASSKRIADALERVESLADKIETVPAAPTHLSEELGAGLEAIRQRVGQLNTLLEGRDLLTYKQMAKLKRESEEQARRSDSLAVQVESLRATVEEIKGGLADLDSRSREFESNLVQHATRESAQFQEHNRRIETIREELAHELNDLDDLERRLRQAAGENQGLDLPDRLDELRMRVLRTERRLGGLSPRNTGPAMLPNERTASLIAENGSQENRSNGHNGNHQEEPAFDYFAYQLRLRGSRAEIKQRQSAYLDLFDGCKVVLDLGCGRGEFVELLKEHSIPVIGVDDSEDMAEFCQNRGLTVVCQDIFDYLLQRPDENVDGIMLSQVVEHLTPDRISRLLSLCAAKLQPGGIIVMESVNTLCPGVLGNFYLDPTHVRPVPSRLLAFMAGQAGLKVQSIRFSQPVPDRVTSPMLETSAELAPGADAYQDYAVVARKL